MLPQFIQSLPASILSILIILHWGIELNEFEIGTKGTTPTMHFDQLLTCTVQIFIKSENYLWWENIINAPNS